MKLKSIFIVLITLAMLLGNRQPSLAHGHVEVGDYELVIGFRVEPAFQGEPNGLDLAVTDRTSGERVNGLDQTLRAEIIYGESRRELTLRPRFGQDGAYTADILPTEAGDYTWRIFGDIQGFPVDVSMTSGPDTFSPVRPKAEVSFPAEEPAGSELRQQAQQAGRTAQIALVLAMVGVALAIAGLLAGISGWRASRRM